MDIVDFPPFYTIQPVHAARENQLELWRKLILKAVTASTLLVELSNCPAFSNPRINRSLSAEDRKSVAEYIISCGNGAWEDPASKQRLIVFSRTPEAWATAVYEWAKQTVRVGMGISTFYEIHSGEDAEGTELFGMDEDILMRALKVLERQGKVQLFPKDTVDEMGVKFI